MKCTLFASLVVLGAFFGPAFHAIGQAWQPPIGIPAPPFGINNVAPALPNPWGGNVAGFYYVQSGGTNIGNGYPTSPRGIIPSLIPGGSVVVIAGTYTTNHDSPNRITANGTASAPVYIRGTGNTSRPTITQKWIVQGSYYVIEYMNFKWANASYNGKLIIGGINAVVRHNDFQGDTGTGVGGVYPSGTDLVVWDNVLRNFGDVNASFDQDNHCISIDAPNSRLWIVDNEITRCSGDGIQLNAGSSSNQPSLHHIYIGRNVFHGSKQSGVGVKQATDVIISQNTCFNHRPSNSSPGACLGGQYAPSYVWFLYNHIYDSESGIRLESDSGLGTGTDTFYVGNLIHDISDSIPPRPDNPHASGGIVLRGGKNRWVVNNTLYNYQAGIMSPDNSAFVHIENNILASRTNAQARDIFLQVASLASMSNMRNNIVPTSPRIQWGGGTTYTSLGSFQAATGKGQGSLSTVPEFVNVAAQDFRLTASSAAVDRGIASAVYQAFFDRYGLKIAVDIVGAPRPQGAAYDIGAYEFNSTTRGTIDR